MKTIYFDRKAGVISDYFNQTLFGYTGIEGIQYLDIPAKFRNKIREGLSIDVTITGTTAGIYTIERQTRTI